MKIIDGIENIKEKFLYPILTVGNFDGVHLGHQAIFRMLVERAKKKKGTSIVFTFEPHPLRVIAPERAPKLLTTFKDKVNLIRTFDIDVLICANFTKEFANMEAEYFVKNILLNIIGVKEIFVGSNYFFGKGRKGSSSLLKELGEKYGFKTTIVPEVKINNVILSSSKIRTLVAKGRVEEVVELLGRHYSIEGVVIEGAKRGKKLFNIPTANIAAFNELLPRDGVYAVTIDFSGKTFGGAANIGYRPTFGNKKLSCEVHLLGFSGNLLGKELRVNFIKRIRDELRFSKIEDLAVQMKKDIEDIKQILDKMGILKLLRT
jgi:riboflavin kinase/FMN adenylyltransferase